MLLAQINKLEERIAELEDEKKQAIPHAIQLEKQQQEIDHFLEWAEEMKSLFGDIEAEMGNVAILDHIVLPFQTQQTFFGSSGK